MNRLSLTLAALGLALCSGQAGAWQAAPTAAAPARDPDRGLAADLRARLGLVDAAKDSWEVERWNLAVAAHLQELSTAWAENRLEALLPTADWIAADLRVGPLFDVPKESPSSGERQILVDAAPAQAEADAQAPLTLALGHWRRCFPAEARLDFEVIGFSGTPPRVEARVRLCASGAVEGARLQHNASWTCAWRLNARSAELIEVRREGFESIRLGPGAEGQFADVSEALFEDPALFRERLAPGLDHWRRRLPANLFPGSLGHHGIAIGDVDGDGLEDLYVCRPGGLPNQLLLHTPQHELRDVSAAAGVDLLDYSSSALLVDFDGDADADLVIATGTGLVFFANDGAAHFERKLLLERSLATSLAAADFDDDGDVDLYVCSYLSPYEKNGLPVPYHDANNGEANMLLRNDGAWSFVDVAQALGMDQNNRRFSLAASWEDFDNDGDMDLYVANDFGRNNLYRNDAGKFRDVAPEFSAEDVSAGMGVAWADVDLDGWMDLYVTNMHSPAGSRLTSQPNFRGAAGLAGMANYRDHAQGNTLLMNRQGQSFSDSAQDSGTSFGRWGWGAIFVDYDNDGALDLFAPNGFVSGERREDLDSFFWRQVVLQSPEVPGDAGANYSLGWRAVNRLMRQGYSWNGHERNVAYANLGGGRFVDVSSAIGLDYPDDSRAAARIDWDGDGDEDLFVSNRNAPMLRALENRATPGKAWIAFELRSADPKRTAIGARVVLEASDGKRYLRTLRCGEGYLAQSSSRLHFGLGAAGVKSLSVRWPGGETEDFGTAATGAAYTLKQGTRTARALPAGAQRAPQPARIAPATSADACARTVLPIPLPLPRLLLETWDGKPASLLGITPQGPQGTGQPLVLLLWSVDAPASLRTLERVGGAAQALRDGGLRQVVALCIDSGKPQRERALAVWKDTGWPFARSFAGEESVSVLELVLAALHDDAHGLDLPLAFLIDKGGRLVSTYQGALDPAQLVQDLGLFTLSPQARRDASVPFPGRWISALPQPLEPDVSARLIAHGLDRPAGEYEFARIEVREFSAANFEYEAGVARQRQGRLPDAIGHYRRALAANPAHAPAAQALAAALHQQGEFDAALQAYKDAIRLEPGHAQTRCNLGYLYIALKDRAGAESELNALRALKSDLAAQLESKIAEFERR